MLPYGIHFLKCDRIEFVWLETSSGRRGKHGGVELYEGVVEAVLQHYFDDSPDSPATSPGRFDYVRPLYLEVYIYIYIVFNGGKCRKLERKRMYRLNAPATSPGRFDYVCPLQVFQVL